jgi:hypothetical protein
LDQDGDGGGCGERGTEEVGDTGLVEAGSAETPKIPGGPPPKKTGSTGRTEAGPVTVVVLVVLVTTELVALLAGGAEELEEEVDVEVEVDENVEGRARWEEEPSAESESEKSSSVDFLSGGDDQYSSFWMWIMRGLLLPVKKDMREREVSIRLFQVRSTVVCS